MAVQRKGKSLFIAVDKIETIFLGKGCYFGYDFIIHIRKGEMRISVFSASDNNVLNLPTNLRIMKDECKVKKLFNVLKQTYVIKWIKKYKYLG